MYVAQAAYVPIPNTNYHDEDWRELQMEQHILTQ